MIQVSFLLLCAIGLSSFLSYNLVRMPVLALFAESLGAGPERIGMVVSASTLTGVLLKLPSGALSDIYGRRLILRVGVLAFGIPPFFYPWVTDLEVLTALRFAHGLATAVFAPTAIATVAEMYRERRGEALGWYTASTRAGSLLGPVLGGWLVYATGFPTTFLVAGFFGCIGMVLFFSLRLTPPPPRHPDESVGMVLAEILRGFRQVGRNIKVLVTSATEGAKMVSNGALMAFLPIYGISIGLNPGEVGALFGVQGITSFLSRPGMGRASDQVGRQPLIVAGLLICAATFALMPHVSGFLPLMLLAAGFGFGEAVVATSTSALVADLSEPRILGAGIGMQGMITDIGHASGPLLAGVLIAQVGYLQAFAAIALMQVAAAGVFWVVIRR
jgi:DHA1 family multidrug resistance protein-like MFS transporter